ncbi:MAG: hypothetical protein U0174_03440 [Polyangiaceae bacterium]
MKNDSKPKRRTKLTVDAKDLKAGQKLKMRVTVCGNLTTARDAI